MSLVGPRPLPIRDYHLLEPWHRKRYLVLPGITGLWQISGRSEPTLRPGAPRLLLPGKLVDLARRDDPAQDDPGGLRAQGRVLSIHPTARGFETAAEVYEQARPDYPADAIDYIVEVLELEPGAHVVDVGAGTGKFARQLVARAST